MQDDVKMRSANPIRLDNYKFSGLDASLLGAIKSVTDYYSCKNQNKLKDSTIKKTAQPRVVFSYESEDTYGIPPLPHKRIRRRIVPLIFLLRWKLK